MYLLFAPMKKKFFKRQLLNCNFTRIKIKVCRKKTPENPSHSVLVEQVVITYERQFAFVFYRLCQACRRPFNDAAVARYPNGVTTHIHCARNKTVCPVTGHVFSSLEHRDEAKDDGSWGREYWQYSGTQFAGVSGMIKRKGHFLGVRLHRSKPI